MRAPRFGSGGAFLAPSPVWVAGPAGEVERGRSYEHRQICEEAAER
jgi:hypothetical protein